MKSSLTCPPPKKSKLEKCLQHPANAALTNGIRLEGCPAGFQNCFYVTRVRKSVSLLLGQWDGNAVNVRVRIITGVLQDHSLQASSYYLKVTLVYVVLPVAPSFVVSPVLVCPFMISKTSKSVENLYGVLDTINEETKTGKV